MKSFVFLYPIPEIIDYEIRNHGWSYEKGEEAFRELYKELLNKCIDLRYRQKGFSINYAVFNGHKVSDVIELQESDRIFEVGMDFKTHTTEVNGEHPYPDNDFILDRLGDIKVIRVAGFHMWDCVNKLARRAHERGLDTLVDEDLTEFFSHAIRQKEFKPEVFPSLNSKRLGEHLLKRFLEVRKERAWLYSDY